MPVRKKSSMRFHRKTLALINEASDIARYYRSFGQFTVKQLWEILCLRKVMKKTQKDYSRLSHVLNCARREKILNFTIAARFHGVSAADIKTIRQIEAKNAG